MFSFDTKNRSDKADIKFLHYTLGNYWSFPKVDNIHIADIKFIFFEPRALVVTSKRGFQFGQHNQDVLEIHKLIKKNN